MEARDPQRLVTHVKAADQLRILRGDTDGTAVGTKPPGQSLPPTVTLPWAWSGSTGASE